MHLNSETQYTQGIKIVEKAAGGIGGGFPFRILTLSPLYTAEQSQSLLRVGGPKGVTDAHVRRRSLEAAVQPTVFILSQGSLLRGRNGADR